ncbi:hypothetical protein A3F00_00905 [Candidatus Daviesbacteria bacterium RIFCSPHIGHO2_12_FULL_37_11]|uniref:Uncharacterized protein n=1 Tax=Candidatus Daviesbacteria bacterium RIFCSPHIGHO2_12_FULL_37_11 TaxID=1797777 RepID=A0A1F5K8M9_9BACT|nr:MAG: hypothetical protein A2111_00080 [Candidatus Daviesbacteria bacterium GWA1_38_6]OGE17413.1 MAG: hypothetical protein A2769_04560 [Candidatus Daviesbacteria bacterium RIFCSPHIGHO2_01_FULL_37_27]OGE37276.1 MAG: hypothetical protein A3F00_00905 [Candidatus Daviesbacteria bacterium RIFCSPHIGHO2_12_FULL_37_11]OGE46053.1 MAG: hypothetical protein A3B39_03540 [Candidatus Daviesbacteria bacterium RIFCSPLOWO2_01_FULL_37_10]
MTKNPFINALAATLYITLIASVMFYGMRRTGSADTIIIPIVMLSLFTLSAAIMGYIFLSQPLQFYLDGKKKDAVDLFLKTVAVFAGITILILILLFSEILS